MKSLMKSNIYEVKDTIIIVGSCLKNMQPKGFQELEKISRNIYEVCLEETHINMAITKIGGMLRTNRICKVIFASVDKSPHCVQLHYIQEELRKMMNLDGVEIENYVIADNEVIKIDRETISLSKNLRKLFELKTKEGDINE